jgi:hypothetical protein
MRGALIFASRMLFPIVFVFTSLVVCRNVRLPASVLSQTGQCQSDRTDNARMCASVHAQSLVRGNTTVHAHAFHAQ